MSYVAGKAILIAGGLTNTQPRLWFVTSTESSGTVDTTGFISDASNIGMKANDYVLHINTTTNLVTAHAVASVTASSAADLTDALAVSSTANSD